MALSKTTVNNYAIDRVSWAQAYISASSSRRFRGRKGSCQLHQHAGVLIRTLLYGLMGRETKVESCTVELALPVELKMSASCKALEHIHIIYTPLRKKASMSTPTRSTHIYPCQPGTVPNKVRPMVLELYPPAATSVGVTTALLSRFAGEITQRPHNAPPCERLRPRLSTEYANC